MLTHLTEQDWELVLDVFHAARSKRGESGRDDRKFLEALVFFTVHNITWRALPAEFGNWNSVWKVRPHVRSMRTGPSPPFDPRPLRSWRCARRRQARFAPLRGGLRPCLTAAARNALMISGRGEETALQPNKETSAGSRVEFGPRHWRTDHDHAKGSVCWDRRREAA